MLPESGTGEPFGRVYHEDHEGMREKNRPQMLADKRGFAIEVFRGYHDLMGIGRLWLVWGGRGDGVGSEWCFGRVFGVFVGSDRGLGIWIEVFGVTRNML